MLDLKALRDDPDTIRAALRRRGDAYDPALDEILALDADRRLLLQDLERRKAGRNRASQQVAQLKREGLDASEQIAGLQQSTDGIKELDQRTREIEERLRDLLLRVPNPPLPELPEGDASANEVIRSWGERPTFGFEAQPHWVLGERLGILDLPRGAKIAGSGFPLLAREGARLQRGLVNFMLDLHVREHGYVEIAPPFLVTGSTAEGTGQLPGFADDMYATTDGLYLVPTAEVPVTNLHREETLAAADLPRGYVAYTPCFRREAGAAGKDTRGLIRVHQFDKVELVRFSTPEASPDEHEKMLGHAEAVLRRLDVPYRVVLLAAGDVGFASAKTYDLEVWAAGVGQWLEASSASTFTDFQARRANIRYRPRPDAKPEFVHTLNASGLALPRTMIALLENNQEEDGSVRIPEALVPYLGTDRLTPGARP